MGGRNPLSREERNLTEENGIENSDLKEKEEKTG